VDAYYISRRRTQYTPKRDKGATMPKTAKDVDDVFDAFLALTSDEQRLFSAMLRGRERAAPPAQATIPIAAAAKRSHKKPRGAQTPPAQAEAPNSAEAKTA
jgi:hypothetical protein